MSVFYPGGSPWKERCEICDGYGVVYAGDGIVTDCECMKEVESDE